MEQGKTTIASRLYDWIRSTKSASQSDDAARTSGRHQGALDGQAILLLTVQGMYAAATALSGTFVPVYLWKTSQSFMLIGWFTLFQYAVSGLTFWLAGKWVKERNKMNSLRLGIVLSGIFYCSILLLGAAAVRYIALLGALSGLASGFFWLAYNIVYFEITEPDNRDKFNGWAGLLGSGAGIFAPWISGMLIVAYAGGAGYRIIFTISLTIFGVAAILSFWLKKRKTEGKYSWLYGFRQIGGSDPGWRAVFLSLMAQGVREGVFMFLIGLLVYLVSRDERMLGSFSLWTSLVGLVAFLLVGRLLTMRRRSTAMLIGVIMLTLVIVPLLWRLDYTTLLVFGIGTALFLPLYSIPMTSSVFDRIGATAEAASHREEYIVLRELGLVLGRLLGLAAYLILVSRTSQPQAFIWLLLGVGVMPVVGWFCIRSYLRRQLA
ncbi:MFS transporter [Paenibacillus daejeonensis]|uniref:MFS transporter n=1 Tax=Paenibacillus daejeonensis TaxID=135193 RepID=UPI000367BBDE|nr:MFS transporter [Paenibacillus daejeonensis]